MTNDDPTSARASEGSASASWGALPDGSGEDTRKSYSWGRNLPALRFNAPRAEERARRPVSAPAVYGVKPPWYLRPVRVFFGLALLAGAWGLALLLMAWAQSIWSNLPPMWQSEWSDFYFALNVVGALGLAVITLVIFLVGVFSLLVGLTARGW
jgi:hypothetical protein